MEEKIGKKLEIKVGGRMSDDILGIKTEDYFENPMKDFSAIGSKLEDEGFNGLAIGDPKYIPIVPGGKFPMAIMNVTDSRDASLHLFDDYGILTALDIHTRNLYVDMVVEQKYVKPERNPSANPPPPGRSSDGAAVDFFKRLNIPERIGEYLITGMLLDRASNRIQVKVGAPELANSDPKFSQAIRKHYEKEGGLATILTNSRAHSEVKNSNSPALPEKPGIHIFIEPQIEINHEKSSCLLHGSIRIQNPALESGTVLKDFQATQFIPVTIVVTGSKDPQPLVFRIKLGVNAESKSENDSLFIGYFSVDLNQFDWLKGGQTYFIYGFAGSLINGPSRLDVKDSFKKQTGN